MNQVISFIIIGGLDGSDGLGLYPLSTSRKAILDLQLILTSLGSFQNVTLATCLFHRLLRSNLRGKNSGAGKWLGRVMDHPNGWTVEKKLKCRPGGFLEELSQ